MITAHIKDFNMHDSVNQPYFWNVEKITIAD
jgi:hypothetical protein